MPNLTDVLEAEDRATIRNMVYGFKNKLINANPIVNQRGQTSGAVAVDTTNYYTLDRWRLATATDVISWSDSGGVRTVTIPSGDFYEQVIEGQNLITGTHTMNWNGTATCTVGGVARIKGESFSVTGGANLTVRFTNGTVIKPQLEEGEKATPFEQRPYPLELSLCHRYFANLGRNVAGGYSNNFIGRCYSTSAAAIQINLPAEMRVVPTLSYDSLVNISVFKADGTVSSITGLAGADSKYNLRINATGATGLVAGNATSLSLDSTVNLNFSAEL